MKKSLSALLVIVLSMIGAKAMAAKLDLNLNNIKMESQDGTDPGGNGTTKNGLVKSTK